MGDFNIDLDVIKTNKINTHIGNLKLKIHLKPVLRKCT